MSGSNIGDELNQAGVSWGWFEGGFRPIDLLPGRAGGDRADGPVDEHVHRRRVQERRLPEPRFRTRATRGCATRCTRSDRRSAAPASTGYKDDYIPHHEPFQYYASTANPHHLTIPTASGKDTLAGLKEIGHDTQSYVNGVPQFNTPNHQYDTSDFDQLVAAITAGQLPASALPAVSFLKAPGYQDGHAGYSDPSDEQQFIVNEINALEKSPDWGSTAVIVNYDDSDGWYDHVYSGVTNPSMSPARQPDRRPTTSGQHVGQVQARHQPPTHPLAGEQGRCGFGPRLPMMVISPYSKFDSVDHNLSDQASIINFVEYNWGLPGIPARRIRCSRRRDQHAGHPVRPRRDVRLQRPARANADPQPDHGPAELTTSVASTGAPADHAGAGGPSGSARSGARDRRRVDAAPAGSW